MTDLSQQIFDALRTTDWPWSIKEICLHFHAEQSAVRAAIETLVQQRHVRKAIDIDGDFYEIP